MKTLSDYKDAFIKLQITNDAEQLLRTMQQTEDMCLAAVQQGITALQSVNPTFFK